MSLRGLGPTLQLQLQSLLQLQRLHHWHKPPLTHPLPFTKISGDGPFLPLKSLPMSGWLSFMAVGGIGGGGAAGTRFPAVGLGNRGGYLGHSHG